MHPETEMKEFLMSFESAFVGPIQVFSRFRIDNSRAIEISFVKRFLYLPKEGHEAIVRVQECLQNYSFVDTTESYFNVGVTYMKVVFETAWPLDMIISKLIDRDFFCTGKFNIRGYCPLIITTDISDATK